MLIAMAGLPGTGKSTLAACLGGTIGAVVLGKDEVRAALFPPPVLDYSRDQDEIAMAAIYRAAEYILRRSPEQAVVIDGRTFLRAYQLRDLLAVGDSVGQTVRVIECVCDERIVRRRLEVDLAEGRHPARNRTYEMYRTVRAEAEPIAFPHLVLDTGEQSREECVRRCLEYLTGGTPVLRDSG